MLSDGRTISYEYDAEERITKVTDSVEGVTEYTYDAMGQLLTEVRDGTVVTSMTYDAYGNILTKNSMTYTYGDPVWKDRLTAIDDYPITYDAQGNPVNYQGHELVWEKGRQLKSYDDSNYTYNANGICTSRTIGGMTHYITVEGTKILREEWEGNALVPLYDNEEQVCGIEYNGTPYFFLKNLQGDVIAITDADGETVARYRYNAWGVWQILSDTSGCEIAGINPFRYRSYYLDTQTGLYYLQSRYYDPTTGRFLNGDDVVIAVTADAKDKGNLFAYCENNPVNQTDSMGFNPVATVATRFALKFGYSLAGKALLMKLTGFLVSCFPYLVAVVAAIVTAYLLYVVVQKAIVRSVIKKIPKRLLKNGKVDLKKFNKNRKGRPGKQEDGGYYVEPDHAQHAGSKWKLFDRAGRRIASLFEDGAIRGK